MKNYIKAEIEYENKIAKDYNDFYYKSFWEVHQKKEFSNFVKSFLKPHDKILDLGCGAATFWDQFKKFKQVFLTGADISPAMIKEAKKLYPNEKFVLISAQKLPFRNEEFDMVICSTVLHHMPQEETTKLLSEIQRILKPYGFLIGREPQSDAYLKDQGWLTGAVMALVHMINSRTGFKPHKEPKVHAYHRSFRLNEFEETITQHFTLKKIISKYPFSEYFKKFQDPALQEKFFLLDNILKKFKGSQIFYAAQKYGYGKKEVLKYIRRYLEDLQKNSEQPPPEKFIKELIKLTDEINQKIPTK